MFTDAQRSRPCSLNRVLINVERLQMVRAQVHGRERAAHRAAREMMNQCTDGHNELPVEVASEPW